jgi:hypothetical protein
MELKAPLLASVGCGLDQSATGRKRYVDYGRLIDDRGVIYLGSYRHCWGRSVYLFGGFSLFSNANFS